MVKMAKMATIWNRLVFELQTFRTEHLKIEIRNEAGFVVYSNGFSFFFRLAFLFPFCMHKFGQRNGEIQKKVLDYSHNIPTK